MNPFSYFFEGGTVAALLIFTTVAFVRPRRQRRRQPERPTPQPRLACPPIAVLPRRRCLTVDLTGTTPYGDRLFTDRPL